MQAHVLPGRSAWSLDLAEVATFPGQPQAPRQHPNSRNAGPLEARAVELDRLWRRCAAEAATSILEIAPDDHQYVSGYLERRSGDRVRVAPTPFERSEEVEDWLRRRPGPVLVALAPSYPEDAIGKVFDGGRRGQVLVMTPAAGTDALSRSARAIRSAMKGPDATWVPDRLILNDAVDCLLWAAGGNESRGDVHRLEATRLARTVGCRSAGLIPLGRWLQREGDLETAISRLETILSKRFLTTLDGRQDDDDLIGLCATILLVVGRRPRGAGSDSITADDALIELAMVCDGPRIPLALALHVMGHDDPAARDELRRSVRNLVNLGLATTSLVDDEHAADTDALGFMSIAAAHQAALRLLNAPLFRRSSEKVIEALDDALDDAIERHEGGESGAISFENLARHSLAACDAVTAARVPSVQAALLMERALSLFSSIPSRSETGAGHDPAHRGTDQEPGADELTDWGLDLADRFLVETRAVFGSLSQETAIAARTVAWTRRNHGDALGALEVLDEAKAAASYVGGDEGRRLKAHLGYLEGTVLVSGNQVDAARAVFQELGATVFPEGVSVQALESSDCLLGKRERVQLGSYLARIEMASGKLTDARERLQDLVYLARRVDSAREVIWNVQQNLGLVLVLQGRVDLAEGILREVEQGRREALGAEHPDTLQTRMTFARLELMRGNALSAARKASEVAEARARQIGPEAPATMSAELFVIRAQLAAGIPCTTAARALATRRLEAFGTEHASTKLAYRVVAQSLLLEGRPDDAIDVLDDIKRPGDSHLGLIESRWQHRHPETRGFEPDPFERIELEHLRLIAEAGASGSRASAWDHAAARLGKLADELRESLGQLHPASLEIRASVAWSLAGGERWDEAREAVESLLRILPESMATHPIAIQAKELQTMIAVRVQEVTRARRILDDLSANVGSSELPKDAATGIEADRLALELLVQHAEHGRVGRENLLSAMVELARTITTRGDIAAEGVAPPQKVAPSPADRLRAEGLLRYWDENRGETEDQSTEFEAVAFLEEIAYVPRVASDSSTSPAIRREVSLPSLDAPKAMRLGLQLLIDDAGLAVRRLADLSAMSPAHVSKLLKSFEAAGCLRRPGQGRPGAVAHRILFAQLAAHWTSASDPNHPSGAPAGIALPLPLWDTLGGLTVAAWGITGDRAAVALGAPIPLSETAPYEAYVIGSVRTTAGRERPGRAPLDQIAIAQHRYGSSAPQSAGTLLQVPHMDLITIDQPVLPELPSIPLAHPIVVALDLWASGDRGREVMEDWDPILDGKSWRLW